MNIWYNDFYSNTFGNNVQDDVEGRDVIATVLAEWLMDPNNSTYEAAKYILLLIDDCKNARELQIAEDMFVALTGWNFETLKTKCNLEITEAFGEEI